MKLSLKEIRQAMAMAAHIDVDEMTATITGSARALDTLYEEYGYWKTARAGVLTGDDNDRLAAAIDGVLAYHRKNSEEVPR